MSTNDSENDRVSRRVVASPPPSDEGAPSSDRESITPETVEQNLNAIDQAMAEHADELLDAEFESVEEVLSRAEEAAASEESIAEQPIEPEPDSDDKVIATETDASAESVTQEQSAVEDSQVDNADLMSGETATEEEPLIDRAADDSEDQPQVIPNRDETAIEEDEIAPHDEEIGTLEDQSPQPNVNEGDDDEVGLTESAQQLEDERDEPTDEYGEGQLGNEEQPESEGLKTEAVAPSAAMDEGAEGEIADAATIQQEHDAEKAGELSMTERIRHVAGRAFNPVLGVLNRLAMPLDAIPPAIRPAIDWIALSLIFWVPIVWVLVLLLG